MHRAISRRHYSIPIWKHVIIIRSLYSWTMPFSTPWTMLGPRTTSECISILLQLPLSSSSSCSPCAPLSQPLYCPFVSSTILHIISSQFDVLSRSLWSKRALLEVLIVHLLYIKSFLEMSLITQIDIQHELINQNSGITTGTREHSHVATWLSSTYVLFGSISC